MQNGRQGKEIIHKNSRTECDQSAIPESPPQDKRHREPNVAKNDNRETKRLSRLPGNSVSEVGERMNGGAVKEDKSPENEAILVINVRDRCGWEVSGNRLREGQRKGLEPTI